MNNSKLEELLFISFLGKLTQDNIVAVDSSTLICFEPYDKFSKIGTKSLYVTNIKDESVETIQNRERKFLNGMYLDKITAEGCGLRKIIQFFNEYYFKSTESSQMEILENFASNIQLLQENELIDAEEASKLLDSTNSLVTQSYLGEVDSNDLR